MQNGFARPSPEAPNLTRSSPANPITHIQSRDAGGAGREEFSRPIDAPDDSSPLHAGYRPGAKCKASMRQVRRGFSRIPFTVGYQARSELKSKWVVAGVPDVT